MYSSFRTNLISLADDEYHEFCKRGIPCDRPFLGVRIPEIRKLVKAIPPADFLDQKVEPLLKSKNEFAVHTGLVCLLDFYVNFDHLFLIFDRLESLKDRDEYYVKMALAWLLAECFIKFPDETFVYLQHSNLPRWTFNKAISKICDSRRIAPETKTKLKQLRKA